MTLREGRRSSTVALQTLSTPAWDFCWISESASLGVLDLEVQTLALPRRKPGWKKLSVNMAHTMAAPSRTSERGSSS